MRKAFILLLFLLHPAVEGKCTGKDGWRGYDKVQHLALGLGVGFIVTVQTESWETGAKAVIGTSLGKELVDSTGLGTCSFQDAAVTLLAGGVGIWLGDKFFLAPVKGGGIVVGFSRTF